MNNGVIKLAYLQISLIGELVDESTDGQDVGRLSSLGGGDVVKRLNTSRRHSPCT